MSAGELLALSGVASTASERHRMWQPSTAPGATAACSISISKSAALDDAAGRTGSFDGTVFVWELSKGAVVGTLRGAGSSPVLGAAWSPQVLSVSCRNPVISNQTLVAVIAFAQAAPAI